MTPALEVVFPAPLDQYPAMPGAGLLEVLSADDNKFFDRRRVT